ncbi:hypothetical protein AMATHDRAFT_938 [Amanita thiersii Skay4041]|uniref:Arrestin C-terminal-like domain-containing protein n=1 Tax=Amanita thiersii Skay4041 TaxID=703135 RepID=A0A2A9P014_9AGAR|nr:hypothetical protein AMATHDRAFT_938 [Amanita thiersii Skay4041]
MVYIPTRPSSPVVQGDHPLIGQENSVTLIFPNAGPTSTYTPLPLTEIPDDMLKDKGPHIDVILESDSIFLRGTGVDVDPAYLTGQVVLTLPESTSLKEITLQFRGKARLPVPPNESLINNNTSLTYIICNRDWSFLEGDKKHTRTLKAGRHTFPFQVRLGGTLPSSVSTPVLGGGSVSYRLRAHATRPGLSHNLQSTAPVNIVRCFTHDSLEYQQTLEVENTWPRKLMYSIMVPHKAWAAGDTLLTLVKFSPLVKGVVVKNITTTLLETTSTYARTSPQDHTRAIAIARHVIVNGQAIKIEPNLMKTHGHSPSLGTQFNSRELAGSSTSCAEPDSPTQTNNDIVTTLTLPIPSTITPSHTLDPIKVHHRVRWSILILNPAGHTSELRCSLPIHVLDYRLFDEVRSHTAVTRRLFFGGPEDAEEDMELPSYTSHVRDRVAMVFLPEETVEHASCQTRTPASPLMLNSAQALSGGQSGYCTPVEPNQLSHLPHAPGSGDNTPLTWLNSELLSQQQRARHTPHILRDYADDPGASRVSSCSRSRQESRQPSRAASRSASPDSASANHRHAGETNGHHHNGHGRHFHSRLKAKMKQITSIAHGHWSSKHGHSNGSGPETCGDAGYHLHRPSQPTSPLGSPRHQHLQLSHESRRSSTESPQTYGAGEEVDMTLEQRMLVEVPDYLTASRAALGGVPPLTSMQGLPSYEEASSSARLTPVELSSGGTGCSSQNQRTQSEPNLASGSLLCM